MNLYLKINYLMQKNYDLIARDNVFATYRSDEKRYNSLYGIKPEEYLDTGKIV